MKRAVSVLAIVLLATSGLTWIVRSASPERTLGVFRTTFDGRLSDQRHNACLAAQKLDGLVVGPGQILSFNDRVGSWSRDQGYRKAPVSFSGTLINSWGGGVCQTSTTLYNAGLLAGLELVERHSHQFAANYVPPGRDAAVAFSNIDLKFRNPYSYPVKVLTYTDNGVLEVKIVGRGETPHVTIQQKLLDSREPSLVRLGRGSQIRVRNPGKAGYEVQTFRTVGSVRELLSQDSYPAMNRVVQRSTDGL